MLLLKKTSGLAQVISIILDSTQNEGYQRCYGNILHDVRIVVVAMLDYPSCDEADGGKMYEVTRAC